MGVGARAVCLENSLYCDSAWPQPTWPLASPIDNLCTSWDVACSPGLVVLADISALENAAFQAEFAPPAKWRTQAMALAAGREAVISS